jgi:hypothetical protein
MIIYCLELAPGTSPLERWRRGRAGSARVLRSQPGAPFVTYSRPAMTWTRMVPPSLSRQIW